VTDSLRVVFAVAFVLLSIAALSTLATRCAEREPELRAAGFERAHALAGAAVAEARAWHALWLDTESLLARSRRAFAQGHAANARLFVARARREAVLAVNQARVEAARYFLEHGAHGIPAAAGERLAARVRAHDGAAAYALAQQLGAGAIR
jgi:hypothetical protein